MLGLCSDPQSIRMFDFTLKISVEGGIYPSSNYSQPRQCTGALAPFPPPPLPRSVVTYSSPRLENNHSYGTDSEANTS